METVEKLECMVNFVVACSGLISHNVRVVGFETFDNDHFIAYFYVWEDNAETRSDIQDIFDDFEAVQPRPISIALRLSVHSGARAGPLPAGIMPVYRAKEAS